MITVSLDKNDISGFILLEPDISQGWKKNIQVFLVFSVFTLINASFFSFSGKWPVLFFSGLELFVLFIALYVLYRNLSYCEIIRFTFDHIIIEKGKIAAETVIRYQRLWSKFYIDHTIRNSNPSVSIRCHNQRTEIGSFLNNKDKLELISLLKQITTTYNQACKK